MTGNAPQQQLLLARHVPPSGDAACGVVVLPLHSCQWPISNGIHQGGNAAFVAGGGPSELLFSKTDVAGALQANAFNVYKGIFGSVVCVCYLFPLV